MFIFCDTDININTGRIWLERKGEVGVLRTRPQMFMLIDTDTNIQKDFGYKGSKGRGWPFTDKTTYLSAL